MSVTWSGAETERVRQAAARRLRKQAIAQGRIVPVAAPTFREWLERSFLHGRINHCLELCARLAILLAALWFGGSVIAAIVGGRIPVAVR